MTIKRLVMVLGFAVASWFAGPVAFAQTGSPIYLPSTSVTPTGQPIAGATITVCEGSNWNSGLNYVAGAVVVFGGNLYLSQRPNNMGNTPGPSSVFWVIPQAQSTSAANCSPSVTVYSDPGLTQTLTPPIFTNLTGNVPGFVSPGQYVVTLLNPLSQLYSVYPITAAGLGTAPVSSVFGRTGVVSAQTGDYSCAQVTGCGSSSAGVSSLNSLAGALNLVAGSNVTVTPSGSNITISSSGNCPAGAVGQLQYSNGSTGCLGASGILTPDGSNLNIAGPSPWIDMAAFPGTPACPLTVNAIPSATISLSTPMTATLSFADSDFAVGCSVYIPGAGPNSTMGAPTAGAVVNHDGTGSTTYKYKIVAVDLLNGYGPASTQFQTSTGVASMNKWQYNLLKWTAPSGTVKEYIIYSDEGTGGSLVKIGTSYFPTFEDTGFYGANVQPSPSWMPTNPPSADGPQGLFTTIAANPGGTTLTLASAATTAVTGVLIYLDNVNALRSALTAACPAQGTQVHIGSGVWLLSGWPTYPAAPYCMAGQVKLQGRLAMVDGPLVAPQALNIQGTGAVDISQPFGNTITSALDSVADLVGVGDQLGAVILGQSDDVFNGLHGSGFQGDYLQFGDTGSDDIAIIATAAPHSGGCVVHLLSQVIGPFSIDGGSVLAASGDSGGKAAICVDTQFAGGGGSTALENIAIGTPNGKQLNWQNHFISFACPFCTSVRNEGNIAFTDAYGEDLLEAGAIVLDPGVSTASSGFDALYNFTTEDIGNDNDNYAGPAFAILNPPSAEPSSIRGSAIDGIGVSGKTYGAMTVTGAPDLTVVPNITLMAFNPGNILYNQYGFSNSVYGLDANVAVLPPNLAVSLMPSGNDNCIECWLMPAPTALSIAVTHSGGTLPAGLHCYVVTANDKQGTPGNTVPSPETCVTNLLDDQNVLSYAISDTGLGGATIWRGTSSGNENVYLGSSQPTTTNTSSYTDTGSAATSAGTPPTQASAYDTMLFNGAGGSKGYFHGNGVADGITFGFGCPPSGTYNWEFCGSSKINSASLANAFTPLIAGTTIGWATAGASPRASVSLTSNATLNVTGMVSGVAYTMLVTSDGFTLAQGTGCTWTSSWVLPGATHGDLLVWIYDGTYCQVVPPATQTIAFGATALATSAISANTCGSTQTVSATGVLTTDAISVAFNGDTTGVTGYTPASSGQGLNIRWYVSANDVNFQVCNPTSGSITPGAATVNWRVTR